jgi:hypothetical protein
VNNETSVRPINIHAVSRSAHRPGGHEDRADASDYLVKKDRNTAAPIAPFPLEGIRHHQLQVLNLLDANEIQGLHTPLYWMEAIDGLRTEASGTATEIGDMERGGSRTGRSGPDDGDSCELPKHESNLAMVSQ